MTIILSISVFTVLATIALFHIYWAFGGLWPAKGEASLVKMVIGTKSNHMPGRNITLIVSLLIFIAGCIPLIWIEFLPVPIPRFIVGIALGIVAFIFLLRGLISYTPIVTKTYTIEPFSYLNRLYYSPLCLVIGVIYLILLLLK